MTMPILAKPCHLAMIGISLILTVEQYAKIFISCIIPISDNRMYK